MAERGKPSTAHEYGANDQCVHCGMAKVNVELLSHVCTPEREKASDQVRLAKEKKSKAKLG